jgi:hypothetical protein
MKPPKIIQAPIDNKISQLSEAEKKIYNSIMAYFPATNPNSAYDKALEGGVKYEHWNK